MKINYKRWRKSTMQNDELVMDCSGYEVSISFASKVNKEVMEDIKKLIMMAYDLRKQKLSR